jgi:uncharacterized membrane protein YraQ (UPF0718 family)
MIEPWFSAGLVALAAIVGGLLPWTRRWSSEGMHRLVALSAGIFLGTVLHMTGDLALGGGAHDHAGDAAGEHGHAHGAAVPVDEHAEHDHGSHALGGTAGGATGSESGAPGASVWLGVVVGFVGLAALERLVLRRSLPHAHVHDHGHAHGRGSDAKHALLWRASLAGLAIHSVFEGFALAGLAKSELFDSVLLFTLLHKLAETFSLSTVLRLAGMRGAAAAAWLGGFALIAPIAFVIGGSLLAVVEPWQPHALAVAIGTFLYVTVLDLLPEAFHRGSFKDRLPYLVFGLAVGGFVPGLSHGHGDAIWLAARAVFVEMAPYLLIGFVAAGFVAQLLDPRLLRRHLAGESARSVAIATIVGAPLPLCSCSVVPVAAGLRSAGAGRGATSAFLVATPETGIDSVATTYALLGPVMAIVRPLAALVSAFTTGLAVAWFGGRDEPSGESGAASDAHDHAHGHAHGHAHPHPHTHARAEAPPAHDLRSVVRFTPAEAAPPSLAHEVHAHEHADDACCTHEPAPTHAHGATEPVSKASGPLVARALRYGFVDLVDDIAWPLALGVAASGVLGAFLDPDWLAQPAFQGPLAYFVMLAIGLPIYVCAAASTPIAAVLLAKGLPPGAVLVFLLASPATNFGSLFVARRMLGSRGLAIHLGVLCAVTLACGVGTDLVFDAFAIDIASALPEVAHSHELGTIGIVSAVVLVLVLVASALRKLGAPRAETVTRTVSDT